MVKQKLVELRLIRPFVSCGDNNQQRPLIPSWMRHRYDSTVCDFGVSHDDILKVNRTDPFTARLDQIFGAVLNNQEPVSINRGDIASAKPSVAIKGIDRRRFIIKLPLNDGVATAIKLAHSLTVMGQSVTGLIYDFHVDTEYPTTVLYFDI